MPEVRIIITDTGNDNIDAKCSDDTVNAALFGKASPLVELTGAQQLALVMCKAAYEYLKETTLLRSKRRIVIPRRMRRGQLH